MKQGEIKVWWSDEDAEYVAVHSNYPSLSWLEATPEGAVAGLACMLQDLGV